MDDFIQSEDYKLCARITKGTKILMKVVEGEKVNKTGIEFTLDDLISLKKYAKAKHMIVCGFGLDEYIKVSSYTISKQIWDALVNAQEGISKIRNFRVAMLFTECETF